MGWRTLVRVQIGSPQNTETDFNKVDGTYQQILVVYVALASSYVVRGTLYAAFNS